AKPMGSLVRYGTQEQIAELDVPYEPQTFITRYADGTNELFSQTKDDRSNPYRQSPTPVDLQAREWRERIAKELGAPGLQIFSGEYQTQPLDPVFMEPEAGLAWLDRDPSAPTLHLVLGTQSTNGDLDSSFGLFAGSRIRVARVLLNSCYPGGGFGGRDVSSFPTLIAIAAAYANAPVR